MSLSVFVSGFVSEDNPDYQKHKTIVEFCDMNNVGYPPETEAFFGDYLDGNIEDYLSRDLQKDKHYTVVSEGGNQNFDIDISKLPPGITRVRVQLSW